MGWFARCQHILMVQSTHSRPPVGRWERLAERADQGLSCLRRKPAFIKASLPHAVQLPGSKPMAFLGLSAQMVMLAGIATTMPGVPAAEPPPSAALNP